MAQADIKIDIVLTLTDDEARTLRDILANIAGYPSTRRKNADNIADSLDSIGYEFDDETTDVAGQIEFFEVELSR